MSRVLAMQAVILAGGLGTRMRPMTEHVPKPMLEINGRPFLLHQLELLKTNGILRILLLVAYLGEQIECYFGDGSRFGLEIAYSHERTLMGTGGALKLAAMKLDEEFVLLNGDTYLAVDYQSLFASFRAARREDPECLGMIVAFENSRGECKSNLSLSPDGRVSGYSKCDSSGLTHVDAGGVVLRKEVLELIPSAKNCSLEEEVYPQLITQEKLCAWPTQQPFIDMGSARGLAALSARLR